MGAPIFTGDYRWFCQERVQSGAYDVNGALYVDLARPLLARIYGSWLIFEAGT
jgi:hypothetical protein